MLSKFMFMEQKISGTRVIIVRHGESTYNIEGRVQGHLDKSTLTKKGMTEARQVGRILREFEISTIYTSPLLRAQQTAREIFNVLKADTSLNSLVITKPQVREELIEINLPLWEGLLINEVRQKYPEAYRNWRKQPHLMQMEFATREGMITLFPVCELYKRAKNLWHNILQNHTGKTILLVGHGGINRALINTSLGLTPKRHRVFQQSNCGISIIIKNQYKKQATQLESLNLTDQFAIELLKKKPISKSLRLFLIRHEEEDWKCQRQRLTKWLQQISIDFAVCSPTQNDKEIAMLISEHHPQVPLNFIKELEEISYRAYESRLEMDVEQKNFEKPQSLGQNLIEIQMLAEKNLYEVSKQVIAIWKSIVASATTHSDEMQIGIILVNDIINRIILSYIANSGLEQFQNFKQKNASISVIDYFAEEETPLLHAIIPLSFFKRA
jgi:phosphoserine phosphatase